MGSTSRQTLAIVSQLFVTKENSGMVECVEAVLEDFDIHIYIYMVL